MIQTGFKVDRTAPDELVLELHGALTEETLLGCEREVRTQLALAKRASLRALWDMRQVTSYTLEARTVMERLERFLAEKLYRIVFVADKPQPRALAAWAVHMAGPSDASLADDLENGRAFLRGRSEPTGVRPIASTRPPATESCKKAI